MNQRFPQPVFHLYQGMRTVDAPCDCGHKTHVYVGKTGGKDEIPEGFLPNQHSYICANCGTIRTIRFD